MKQLFGKISFWLKFVGWANVIAGGIVALIGLLAFIIGAIPGLLMIFLGVKLLNAAKYSDMMARYDITTVDMQGFVSNLCTFFLISGVLIIIDLVFFFLQMPFWSFW